MGAGWYHENYYKPRLWDLSTDQLAEEIIRELREGMEGTDVKAGIIGEIGAQYNRLSAIEERVLRAAARAQIETDVGLTTHTTRGIGGLEQLDILEQEGVDLSRVVLAHSGGQPYPRYHAEIVRRGACVSFDRMGSLPDMTDFHRNRVLRNIRRLIDDGHVDRIVLSHDVCYADDLATNGGCGYAWLPIAGREMLKREIGLTDDQWQTIMVETPNASSPVPDPVLDGGVVGEAGSSEVVNQAGDLVLLPTLTTNIRRASPWMSQITRQLPTR